MIGQMIMAGLVAAVEAGLRLSGVSASAQWGESDPSRVTSGAFTSTAGRALIALMAYEAQTVAPTVTDSKGNTGWIVGPATPPLSQYGLLVYLRWAILPIIDNAGAGHTVACDWGDFNDSFATVTVVEAVMPPGMVLSLDASAFNFDGTSPYEASITPNSPDTLLLAHTMPATATGSTPSLPVAPGWTFVQDVPFTSQNWPAITGARLSPEAVASPFSLTFGTAQDAEALPISLLAFKAAAEPPPVAYGASTLLHFNGAGSAIDDDVPGNVWEAVGGATQNAGVALVAGSSLALSGAGQYVKSVSNLSRYLFGAGDFRICFTLLWDRTGTSPFPAFIDFRDAGGSIGKGFVLYGDNSFGGLSLYADNGDGTSGLDFNIATIPNDGLKSEIEVSRTNGVLSCYVRGQRTYNAPLSWVFTAQASQLCVGVRYFDLSQFVKGRIDEVLIEKGVGGRTGESYRPPSAEWVRPSTPWSPALLANTKAWYVSDNPANTVASGLTTALADKAGGSASLAVNAGAGMTNTLGGRPVLRSGGGAGIFKTYGASADAIARTSGGITIYAVHRAVSMDGASYPAVASTSFGDGTNTLQVAMMRSQDGHPPGSINLRTRPTNYSGGLEVGDNTDLGDAWLIAGGARRFNHDDGFLRINGVQTAAAAMDGDNVSQDIDMSLMIGSYSAWAGDEWTAEIAEVIFVRDDVRTANLLRIEGHLAWEWGLSSLLPADHPYKFERPMAGGADAAPSESAWTQVGVENGTFTLGSPGRVRYGVDTRWIELDLPAGTHSCSNEAFGSDPASGTGKSCQLRT